MSFARFLHHIPAGRRPYSSFFSSKPGGGRYFNSAKSSGSKSHVVTRTSTPTKATVKPDAADSSSPSASTSAAEVTGKAVGKPADGTVSSKPAEPAPQQRRAAPSSAIQLQRPTHIPPHPTLKPEDFILHQFFSLHRPLLLLADPAAILRPAASTGPLFDLPASSVDPVDSTQVKHGTLGPDGVRLSPEEYQAADLDTARQLTRALTMSRLGAVADWERTLAKLGHDVSLQPERIETQMQIDQEWEDIMMDSTKRKRRKKMRKHKLKKRRRLTRMSRLKERMK
ncbi:hypothetical protein FISHEDRAFT_62615 [Fistulina hepatica ATCC 64428]|nr:hypothetical protein FISHEDRAFT_62615 [Fistulina hepatica ATCC 64428]